jgi:hypothetical protein
MTFTVNALHAFYTEVIGRKPLKMNWISMEYRHTSEILQVRFQITAIKRVTRIFWFPSAYKSYVYTILYCIKCAIIMTKNNVHTLIKNTLLLKNANHHLSFQRVVIFLPQYWWLLTDQGGGCWRLGWLWIFLKIRQQWSLQNRLTLPFTKDFSLACDAVW